VIGFLLARQRLLGLVVGMMMLVGIAAYFNMARQEDPSFPHRAGLLVVQYPGATAEAVERLVLRPLEEELLQVEEVDFIKSTARNGVAIVRVMQHQHIYATSKAWDRVRQAMTRAELQFPEGVGQMSLDDRLVDIPIVVLALRGAPSLLTLSNEAERLKDALMGLPSLSRIDINAQADEQITLAIDDAALSRIGLTPEQLAQVISSRNQVIPGGFVVAGGKRLAVLSNSEFVSIDDLRRTQIPLPDGSFVPLAAVAEVWRGPLEPAQSEAWFNGERVVLLNIYARRGQVDAIDLGIALRAKVAQLGPDFAPLQIEEMFFQPDQVAARLHDLEGSLLISMMIIIAVVFYGMGLRTGLLVATMLPVVGLITLGVYNLGGGVLHQVAIIGMVVSLGILIDNGIVMVENIQTRLAEGAKPGAAVVGAVSELVGPLGASTATTLAAFTPLLLSKGGTGDFTRGVPVMIMLSLAISFLISVSLAPLLAARFLKPSGSERGIALRQLGERIAIIATGNPRRILKVCGLIVLISFLMAPFLSVQFFPNADRPLVIIDLLLPEGTDQVETARVSELVEHAMYQRDDVTDIHRFVGFSGPAFFYNLFVNPQAPNRARLVVLADDIPATREVMSFAREYAAQQLPEVVLATTVLGQGPPRDAPVEVRVYHPDDAQRQQAAEQVFRVLRAIPGAVDVRHTIDQGTPALRVEVDDAVAQRSGLSRADVARTLFGQSYGLTAEQYRQERDPMPIVLRSVEGTNLPLSRLLSTNIYPQQGAPVPLMQVARVHVDWQPAAVSRRNGERVYTVSANLYDGYSFSQILDGLNAALAATAKAVAMPIRHWPPPRRSVFCCCYSFWCGSLIPSAEWRLSC
jgi:multidrug efflux pump subunit AcrB